MQNRRKVEVFSARCASCEEAVALVRELACPSCEVEVLDMRDPGVSRRAHDIGVRSVPAVAVDGRLAGCCQGRGVDADSLQAAGIGRPIP
jgi:hypothetical protein